MKPQETGADKSNLKVKLWWPYTLKLAVGHKVVQETMMNNELVRTIWNGAWVNQSHHDDSIVDKTTHSRPESIRSVGSLLCLDCLIWTLFQYPMGRFIVSLELWDLYFDLSDRFDIGQAPRHQMRLSHFKAIRWFRLPISRLRNLTSSSDKTSYRIMKAGRSYQAHTLLVE